MKEIIVTTQKEFDDLPEKFDEYTKIIIKNDPLVGRIVINKNLGNSSVVAWVNSSVMASENSSVMACGNSSVEAWGNSSVEAWGNSSVEAWGNSSVMASGNSSVVARENSSVVARENSSIMANGNSSVKAYENSSVKAWGTSSVKASDNSSVMASGNSSVMASGNSSVVAYDNSSVKASGNVVVRLYSSSATVKLFMFASCYKMVKGENISKESPAATVIEPISKNGTERWLSLQGVISEDNFVIIYKRVSFDFKTQEGTVNETLWKIGRTLSHPNYIPDQIECGPGKYHGCSFPYFCDEFRQVYGDKYIAIKVKVEDLYAWANPQYPYKIAFREGTVLYECDKFGKQIVQSNK